MSLNTVNADEEWEYEYDHTRSEVFFVDLDLTTVNRTIKPASTHRGKRTIETAVLPKAKRRKADGAKGAGTQNQGVNANATVGQENEDQNDSDEEDEQTRSLQILDLHTENPIVSYQGRVYSCSWTDMVGTIMFFSDHRDTPLYDPEIVTDTYDMIGTSRIKLVGNLATVKPTKKPTQSATASVQDRIHVESNHSLGTIRRSNAKVNADIRRQANFLEQLMNIKKNRGEEDSVRVVMNNKIAKVEAAGKMHLNTQRRREEIDELNRRVVRGDADALHKLERIYIGQDNDDSDDDQIAEDAQEESARPVRVRNRRVRILEPDMDIDEEIIIADKDDPDFQAAEDQADVQVAANPPPADSGPSNVT